MTSKFSALTEAFYLSPQITVDDIAAAKDLGVTLIINNRPDGEEPGQPTGAAIEEAARQAGLAYVAIPVGPTGLSNTHLEAFNDAIAENSGKTLGYCRSGFRSSLVYAAANALKGRAAGELIAEVANAGYDISGHRGNLEALNPG